MPIRMWPPSAAISVRVSNRSAPVNSLRPPHFAARCAAFWRCHRRACFAIMAFLPWKMPL
jgi:hypothetical protein